MKSVSKTITLKCEPNTIMSKRADRALARVSHIAKLKKSNHENLLEIAGCAPEMLARSFARRGMQKGFLANGVIDERHEHCQSHVNMIKNLPRKLSPETLEIAENFDIVKKLRDQFQSIGRITEELFKKLGMPEDTGAYGVEILELRRSEFMPRQRYQLMSTELHLEMIRMQKEKVLQQKKSEYLEIKVKTQNYVDSCTECQSRIMGLMKND